MANNLGKLAYGVNIEELSKNLYRFTFLVDDDAYLIDMDKDQKEHVVNNCMFRKPIYDYNYMDKYGNIRVVKSTCMEVKLFKGRLISIREKGTNEWLKFSI